MGRKWFILVDRDGRPLGPTRSALVDYEIAGVLLHVVASAYRHERPRLRIPSLLVFANWDAFFRRHKPLEADASIRALGGTETTALVVTTPVPWTDEDDTSSAATAATIGGRDTAVWFGARGSVGERRRGRGGGIDLDDPRALSRRSLTTHVITRLDQTHVLQIDSPTKTGKTTLAALVCRDLQRRCVEHHDRLAIASVSLLAVDRDTNFHDAFYRNCGIAWTDFLALRQQGSTLYLVVDEAQLLYIATPHTSPNRDALALWQLVERVLTNTIDGVRVLLLIGLRDPWLLPPVAIPADHVLGSAHLHYGLDEIHAYVTRQFRGVQSLEADETMTRFCSLLFAYTGGHVGLCATVIRAMNRVATCRGCTGQPPLTPDEWNDMMQRGSSLYGIQLVDHLKEHDAVTVSRLLEPCALARLERLLFRVDHDDDAFLHRCVLIGVLVRDDNGHLAFSSPVLWRFFVLNCIGRIERAKDHDAPTSLSELMRRCQHDMAVDRTIAIPTTNAEATRRRLSWSAIAIEQAWQLAFYKAVYRATPRSFRTSMDDGALFGSSVFVDLMVRKGNDFVWGIERVSEDDARRWHDRHEEVAARFAPGGEYARLKLSDFCFVRFGHSGVDVVNDTTALDGGNSDATVNGATADATTTKLFVMKGYDDHDTPLVVDDGSAKQWK